MAHTYNTSGAEGNATQNGMVAYYDYVGPVLVKDIKSLEHGLELLGANPNLVY